MPAIQRRPIISGEVASRNAQGIVRPAQVSARFSLRLPASAAEEVANVSGLQIDLPINTCRATGDCISARLGPDEWLLLGPETQTESLAREIAKGLEGRFFSLVDIGHRNVSILVEGNRAREIINGGCALDLDDPRFPAGSATRTLLGKAEIVLIRSVSREHYRIECWRSFAPYVYGFLSEVAREFAGKEGPI